MVLFFNKEVAHANSAWLVLAMPNAAHDESMGRVFGLYAIVQYPSSMLSAMRFTGDEHEDALREMPAKSAAVVCSGGGR